MGLPKSKTSRSARGQRRAHDFLVRNADSVCTNCKASIRPHRICTECGHYKGKEVVRTNN